MAVALLAAGAAGCTSDDAADGGSGATTEEATGPNTSAFARRADAYLRSAVDTDLAADASSRTRVWHAVATLASDADAEVTLSVEDLATITERFANFTDTTDFDMIALLNLWNRSDAGARLPEATRDHVRGLILAFKYWYDQPQPDGIIDERWYWSENHQILFHTIEYLAGQAFPDDTFTNAGWTGSQHMEHARPLIERWVSQRAKWGFTEWLSNVYYQEDLEALVGLAEFADDDALSTLGAIGADLILYDLASHTHAGSFGVTHGRSYKKDKMSALDEDTWDVSKLVLDDATEDYQSPFGAVFLASATSYRPPAVLAEIAADDGDAPSPGDPGGVVERSRHSLELDPLAEVTDAPQGPMGLAFDDPENLAYWWSMGALTPWQTVVESTDEMTRYNLWEAELFAQFRPFEPIIKAADPATIRALARSLAPQLNIGLLSSANTVTWRTDEAMLSTVMDFRKGQASQQHHVWQATFSPLAQVFTTHPTSRTEPGEDWHSNSEDWTGNASLPRSVQHRNVGISIYAPLFAPADALLGEYQPYTHAYVPQDHFDEVVTEGNWVFARHGDAYLALYSWRLPEWVTYDDDVDRNGLTEPFELVANGGPNNVWITELGSRRANGSFEEFRSAIAAEPPVVTPLGDPAVHSTGFDVRWTSPTAGEVSFGWDAPFVVDGEEIETSGLPRIDSPWAQVPFDSTDYRFEAGGEHLELDVSDVTAPTRVASSFL